jgi:EmrB/QacA subfamily drug resistance transporter
MGDLTGQRQHNPWAVLIVVSLGFFMGLLDLTIVNIAIPNMIAHLHASLDDILWVINGYALVLAVLLITAGRLGDLYGTRSLFVIGVVVFTASSLACGLAASPGELIGFRVVQGVGAAILMPQTLTMIMEAWPPERRGIAMGIWSAIAGLATVAGPTLGGVLVTAFSWRSIFFVNLPVGAAAVLGAVFFCPNVRKPGGRRLDVRGTLLATLGLLGICYGLIEGQRYNWATITSFISVPLVIAAGVVVFAGFLAVEAASQQRQPLLPFALFRDRNFSVMSWVSGALAIALPGFFLMLTIYLQNVLGMSALRAGLTMAASAMTAMFFAPAAGQLTDRIGGKYILFAGLIWFGAGMGWLVAIAQPGSHWYGLLPPLVVIGAGMGCIFAPMTTVAMQHVPLPLAGAASGVFNTTRQVGDVLGIAAVGALLQTQLATSLTGRAIRSSAGLPGPVRQQFIARFRASAAGHVQVGSNGRIALPPGTPPQLAHQVTRLAGQVFGDGFVAAMRPTIVLPVTVIGIAAVSCLLLRGRATSAPGPATQAAPARALAPGSPGRPGTSRPSGSSARER